MMHRAPGPCGHPWGAVSQKHTQTHAHTAVASYRSFANHEIIPQRARQGSSSTPNCKDMIWNTHHHQSSRNLKTCGPDHHPPAHSTQLTQQQLATHSTTRTTTAWPVNPKHHKSQSRSSTTNTTRQQPHASTRTTTRKQPHTTAHQPRQPHGTTNTTARRGKHNSTTTITTTHRDGLFSRCSSDRKILDHVFLSNWFVTPTCQVASLRLRLGRRLT